MPALNNSNGIQASMMNANLLSSPLPIPSTLRRSPAPPPPNPVREIQSNVWYIYLTHICLIKPRYIYFHTL